jgi:hypothetical protein
MEAARTSWKLVAARDLTRRQLLFIADMLRSKLIQDRRDRDPQIFEDSAQLLPLQTPEKDTTNSFGAKVSASMIGPLPRPVPGKRGPGFTFVGVPGEEPLQYVSMTGHVYRQKGSRQSKDRPCYTWLAAERKLVFNERSNGLPGKRRIEGVFLHPMEAHEFTKPGGVAPLLANRYDFEYPLRGDMVMVLLQMAAQHENVTKLLPPDLENDDQPNSSGRVANPN